MESLLINRSIKIDPHIRIFRQSDQPTNLMNNYAPLEKRLEDSMNTRRIYPTARYLTSKEPLDLMSTGIPDLSRLNEERVIPILDRVTLLNKQPGTSLSDRNLAITPNQVHPTLINTIREQPQSTPFSKAPEEIDRSKIGSMSPFEFGDSQVPDYTLANYFDRVSQMKSHPVSSRLMTGQGPIRVEKFTKEDNTLDVIYLTALRSRIIAVMDYISQRDVYSFWSVNWKEMERNLKRSGSITFDRLEASDADAAFVVSKGEEKKLKIRAENFKYIPLNISQYILYHECAHLANFEYGHGKKFKELLALLCLAAFECGFIRIESIPKSVYTMTGVPILSREDIKNEILDGIAAIQSKTNLDEDYYFSLIQVIESF